MENISDNTLTEYNRCSINSYACELRDIADKDYIIARFSYQNDAYTHFLWGGLQAIEKYLKAIALFEDIVVKNDGHNLVSLFKKIDNLYKITKTTPYKNFPTLSSFDVKEDLKGFLKRLFENGMNRYFSFSYTVHLDDLLKLDEAVWIIRRYCWQITDLSKTIMNDKPFLDKEEVLKELSAGKNYSISGGFIEKICKNKKHEFHDILLRGNSFFAPRDYAGSSHLKSISQRHLLDRRYDEALRIKSPEILQEFIELAEHVTKILFFSKEEKEHMGEMIKEIRAVKDSL